MTTYYLKNDTVKFNCIQAIKNLDETKEWQVDIKPAKSKRSITQNALYWLWLREIAKQRYESGKELLPDTHYHMAFKSLFLGRDETRVFNKNFSQPKSTTKLSTKEFTEYLENIEYYMGSEEGINLPHPDDKYYEAMGL